jgi:hypothetical protein
LLFSALCALSSAQYPGAKPVPNPWRAGFKTITESRAKDILGYLAGPELRGRGSLTPDFFAAAGYVAWRLKEMGLEPAGDAGSFFQRYDLVRSVAVPAETSIASTDGSLQIPYGPNFQVCTLSDTERRVKFAFVTMPKEADISNFDWESLRGRIVVYSSQAATNSAFMAKLSEMREKLALEQVITVALERLSTNNPQRSTGIKDFPDPRNGTLSPLRFSLPGMKQIADKLGVTKYFEEKPNGVSVELPNGEFNVKVKVQQEISPLLNVVAKLPGSDPDLAKEAVVIGSHLDHLGPSNDGIRYGADDNGSGCTANLLVAKALVSNPVKPKRSVLFAFWAAEEVGLYGSYAYMCKPSVAPENTVAYFNLDMLGRNEEFGVEIAENNVDVVYPGIVTTNSMDFYNRLVANNAFVYLRFKPDKTDRTNRSDTRNFVWKGVPTVKVFTGEHPDYHRAGDTLDKINWTKLVNITKWLYLSVGDLATRADRPKFAMTPFAPPSFAILQGRLKLPADFQVPSKAKQIAEVVDAAGTVLAKQELPLSQSQLAYEVLVPKSQLATGGPFTLRVRIMDGSKELLSTPTPLNVPADGWTRAQDAKLEASPHDQRAK